MTLETPCLNRAETSSIPATPPPTASSAAGNVCLISVISSELLKPRPVPMPAVSSNKYRWIPIAWIAEISSTGESGTHSDPGGRIV